MEFWPYTSKDNDVLRSMVQALYSEDPGGEAISPAKIMGTVEQLTYRPDKGEIILFWDGSRCCGYSILLFMWSNELGGDIVIVDEVYVRPQFRSRGLGKDFFAWLETRYSEAKAVALETNPANTRARDLYLRLGFQVAENIRMLKKI